MLQQMYRESTMSRTYVSVLHKRYKEGSKEVKDDFKSWKPSASRTKVSVEWVRQRMGCDRRLTVWMITSLLNMKNDIKKDSVLGRLSLKIWACLKNNGTGCANHSAISGWEEHRRIGTTSLFTWSCSVRLPFSQGDHQKDPFGRGHLEDRNDGFNFVEFCFMVYKHLWVT